MLVTRTLLLLLLVSVPIAAALAVEVPVCIRSSDQVNPDVDGDNVVWEDHQASTSRIYLNNTRTGTMTIIPPLDVTTNQYEPSICGDSVVYISRSKLFDEVRLYSIATGTSRSIRSSADHLESPDVYSDEAGVAVVWTEFVQDDPEGAPNSEIWLYTRTSGHAIPTVTQVSTGGYESNPRIDRDWIAWMHKTEVPGLDSYRGPYDVYARAVSGGAPVLVSTTTAGERNMFPAVSGSRVAWQASADPDGYGGRVLVSSLPVPAPVIVRPAAGDTPAATRAFRQPAISGMMVIYVDSDMDAPADTLMATDLGTGIEYGLCASDAAANPRMTGDAVVWQDRRSGNWDIYMANTGPTAVMGCTLIDSPGYYMLTADIVDSPCPVAIDIRCSHVLFDGQGHRVDGVDAAGSCGIYLDPLSPDPGAPGGYAWVSHRNVAVRNVKLTDWSTGLFGVDCSNSSLSGISAQSGSTGIWLDTECEGNVLTASSASGNSADGLWNVDHSSLTVTGCSFTENGGNGVYGWVSGTTLRNSTVARNGEDGLHLQRATCQLYDSAIRDNAVAGIHFNDATGSTIAGTTITGNPIGISDISGMDGGARTIYNNHFNNTVNTNSDGVNSWNVTAQPGPNIVGGPSIGGNYWAQPDGFGFSQRHPDLDDDGFCDMAYVVKPDEGPDFPAAIDNLPLRNPADPANPIPLPNIALPPRDLDADGLYDDVNGNGRADFADVVLYFNQMTWIAANEPIDYFDYNGNGRIDFADVVWLFNHL